MVLVKVEEGTRQTGLSIQEGELLLPTLHVCVPSHGQLVCNVFALCVQV